jgi:genome maintenance exonuclease 1
MHINKIFDYRPLERINTPEGRRYIVGEDQRLPSVTTILGKTKDMTHLLEWKKKVGEAEAAKIVATASSLGNSMHKNLENHILGESMGGNVLSQILAKVIIKEGLSKVDEIWGTEVALYSTGLYAGTTDLIGIHEGIPSIMDFKNSLNPKKREWIDDYFMQLAAYSMAHNEMFGTSINRGVVMIATRDAKYQEFIIEGDEFTKYETMWAEKLYVYYDKYGSR